jgi:hypothetical protein
MDKNETSEQELSVQTPITAKFDIAQTMTDSKVFQAQVKAEKKARQKAEKALAEAQEALSVTQTDLEKERIERMQAQQDLIEIQDLLEKTRIEVEVQRQAWVNAEQEKAIADSAPEDTANTSSNRDESTISSEANVSEQMVSIVIRLAVDKHGQTKRTQIVHALSGKQDVFSSFNVQRVVDFIESTIAATIACEGAETLIQNKHQHETNPVLSLAITDLQADCINDMDKSALIFKANTPISVRTHFQVSGTESLVGYNHSVKYTIRIYAQGVDTKSSSLVATKTADLVAGVPAYSSQMQISGLPAGIFRLGIISIIPSPVNIAKITQERLLQVFEP